MKSIPRISETEWQIMKLIWLEHPITANQIVEKFKDANWKPKTIKSFLNRLVNKEAVGFDKEGREYLYYPLVSEDECIKAENKSFLERIYGGSLNLMIANFMENEKLTEEEIEELKQILDKKGR